VAPLLLAGAGVGAQETRERCRAWRPRRGVRAFVDNRSVLQHPRRSGYVYPRYDARLHHGDEVHLKTAFGNWLTVTDRPVFALQGKPFDLQEVQTGRFCSWAPEGAGGAVSCEDEGAPGKRRFEVAIAGSHMAIRTSQGRYCSDRPQGVACQSKAISSWEAFQFVEAGGGRVRLKGLRGGKFCGDGGRGLVCDQSSERAAPVFRPLVDSELWPVPALSADQHRAATFIVHREDLDSPMVALYCKGRGRYLAAEDGNERLSCSSSSPWYLASARVTFRNVSGPFKWDLRSVTLRATHSGSYLAPSRDWHSQGQALLSSAKEVKWQVLVTGGCETLRPLIRGVNLGNWFLVERWMNASLFQAEAEEGSGAECKAQDEYGLMSLLGPEAGRRKMEEHWSSWITEDDIKWMASHGVNAVRVPFGYWMVFPMPPFVPGQLKYLERLFHWCEKHSISVLLDFHGLKGSQTGTPTSGNCGGCGKDHCGRTWLDFLDEQKLNLEVIRRLAVRFSRSPSYLGFAVANEVSPKVDRDELMSFYQRAYDIIRYQSRDALVVLYGTFTPSLYPWDNVQQASVDVHIYFGWGFGSPTLDQRVNLRRAQKAVAQVHWPVLVGEWSLAANGHRTLHWDSDRRDRFFDRFARMQLQAWETSSTGWFYWNYKTRFRNSTWNYRDVCELGWIPGCTGRLKFGPGEWWRTPTCAYAYMDGQCKGGLLDAGGELASVLGSVGWLHVSSLAALVMAFVAGVVVLRQCTRSPGPSLDDPLPWATLPELPAMPLSTWDIEQEPMMKGAAKVATEFSS